MRVALVAHNPSGFVRSDVSLLESLGHEVRLVSSRPSDILQGVRWSSHVVVWFAGEHAFYAVSSARLKNKPSLVILGGQEQARDFALPYGLWTRPWHVTMRARWAMRHATDLWAVAQHLADSALRHARLQREVCIVPEVLDPEAFHAGEKDGTVVLPVSSLDEATRARKGVPLFIQAKESHPELPMRVLTGLDESHYRDALARASVILNLSKYEGLATGLCQGMLCEAVPVVTPIPANLEALGPLAGDGEAFLIDSRDALVEGIRAALRLGRSRVARERIVSAFPVSRRREAFREFLER